MNSTSSMAEPVTKTFELFSSGPLNDIVNNFIGFMGTIPFGDIFVLLYIYGLGFYIFNKISTWFINSVFNEDVLEYRNFKQKTIDKWKFWISTIWPVSFVIVIILFVIWVPGLLIEVMLLGFKFSPVVIQNWFTRKREADKKAENANKHKWVAKDSINNFNKLSGLEKTTSNTVPKTNSIFT